MDPGLDLATLRIAAEAADLSGDGTPEVVVSVRLARAAEDPPVDLDPEPQFAVPAWVLGGTDGALLWSV